MTGFLQESQGNNSSTRVMFVIGLVWAMVFTTVSTFMLKWTPGEVIAVFASLSGVFVGLKLGQKPMEKKVEQIKKEDNGN